jgi:hypothetical protein
MLTKLQIPEKFSVWVYSLAYPSCPIRAIFVAFLLVFHCTAQSRGQESLKIRPELSNYEDTSRYDDVIGFIKALNKLSGLVRYEVFGTTQEKRDMPLLIIADPPVSTPMEARRSGKLVVFIMGNIHAGEVEGKEAAMLLARRLALGDLHRLLDRMVVLINPIYNADGNEKISLQNRTNQNGPIGGVGVRENAARLDLNRDFTKLESPEAQALVRLFNRWDPHVAMDLHTTNGSYHGYQLTYAPGLNPNTDPEITRFQRERMLPAVTDAVKKRHSFRIYYYGDFSTLEALKRGSFGGPFGPPGPPGSGGPPRSGNPPGAPAGGPPSAAQAPSLPPVAGQPAGQTRIWRTYDHRPRYGINYFGLRNRLAFLSEAFSYVEFKRRIEVTSAFVEEILNYSHQHAGEIAALTAAADRRAVQAGLAPQRGSQGVAFEPRALPKPEEILVGEVEKKKNPRSGRDMTAVIESKFHAEKMLNYGIFGATQSMPVPAAYLFRSEPAMAGALEKLKAHGINVEELLEPATLEVEVFTLEEATRSERVYQGHRDVRVKGKYQTQKASFEAGTVVIRMAQPLASVIFYLLEPQSDDGLVAWNFLDSYLQNGTAYPIMRLMQPAGLATRLK